MSSFARFQRRIARDDSSTGSSPTATMASEGSAASAKRSSRAKLKATTASVSVLKGLKIKRDASA